ncbi:MAG: hypothetical protein ACT4NL_19040 [Pseudomarimonas sp.]
MADPVALQGFIDKWLAKEPEIALLEVFCPRPQRTVFRTWGALRSELVEVIFELSDAAVARTKLAWWITDLAAGEGGRHPLTRALFAEPKSVQVTSAHWHVLLSAAMPLLESDHAPANVDASASELLPFAQALGAIESELLDCHSDATSIAWHLQIERSLRGLLGVQRERARIPAEWRVEEGPEVIGSYARALLANVIASPKGSLLASFHHLQDQQRLRQLAGHGDPPRAVTISPWRGLLLGWRAARLSLRSVRQSGSLD